jgi:hypothetical protein
MAYPAMAWKLDRYARVLIQVNSDPASGTS